MTMTKNAMNGLELSKISIIVPSLNGGGAEKVAVNLANYYSSIGHQVDLVVFKKPQAYLSYLSLVSHQVNLIDFNVSRRNLYSIFNGIFKLRVYLKRNRNSLVLSVSRCANIWVGLSALGLRLLSLTYREASTLNNLYIMPKSKQFLYKKLMRFSYKKANLIIANSFDTKAHLLAEKITKEEKIVVIVNPVLPVDYWSLQTKSVDEEWFNDKDLKVVLSVGRLHSLKNFGFLIQVFKEVFEKDPNARLMIVGDGDEKENLLSLINQLSLSTVVKLVNFQQNIFPYYAQAHVFALSSNWEGFGNVLVEALSAGLPVVSTNCPGGPKMILQNGKYGQLIPLGDKSAYAEALLNELHKPKCRDEKLIQYAQNFIVSKIAQDYYMAMTTTSSLLCFAIMNL